MVPRRHVDVSPAVWSIWNVCDETRRKERGKKKVRESESEREKREREKKG